MTHQDEGMSRSDPTEATQIERTRWIERDTEKERRRQTDASWGSLFPEGDHHVMGPDGNALPAAYDPHRYARVTPQVREFLFDGGWHVERGTVHRGVLHPDEYIDHEALQVAVEDNLGFTFEQVQSVYASRAGGPVPNDLRQLRDSIDARMLALSLTGANMDLLRRLLSLPKNAMSAAIAREKAREEN